MKIKVFIDTNALRSISFNDKYFESLNLLSSEGAFEFIIPFFVYREYLKYRQFQVIDEVTKILHSTKKLQKELNVVRISSSRLNEISDSILSSDAISPRFLEC